MFKKVRSIFLGAAITIILSTNITNAISDLMYEYNKTGLELMDEEKYEEAIGYFEKSLKESPKYKDDFLKHPKKIYEKDDELWDTPLNNLSWAYYELGDYEKSIKYIKESLRILPNDHVEYFNGAKAYFELGHVDRALDYYKKAAETTTEYYESYFGMGRCYYEKGEYKKALEAFNKYLEYNKDSINTHLFKVYCYLYDSKEGEALTYIDNLMKTYPDNENIYYDKAEVLKTIGDYDKIKEFYHDYIEKFSEKGNLECEMGRMAYGEGRFEDALNYFKRAIEKDRKNEYYHVAIGYTYRELGELEKAYEYGKKAIDLNNDSYTAYTLLGDVEITKGDYKRAIENFNKSIDLEPDFESAYEGKLASLYLNKRYEKVIEIGLEYEKIFEKNYGISLYLGNSYFQLLKYKEAIDEYKNIYSIDPENSMVLSSISMCYLYLDDFNNAGDFADKSLNIDPIDTNALFVKEYIQQMDKPIIGLIDELFKEEYLYYGQLKDYDKEIKGYLNKKDLSNEKVDKLLSELKKEDDIFTYSIYGKDYDSMSKEEEESKLYTWVDKELSYVKIDNFYLNTDEQFIKFIDSIDNSEKKKLIIDLRYNPGGTTESANVILDVLLPECVVSSTIDKNNKKYEYISDEAHTKFEKIYIFVDKNTASAAELLTLGLKDKLENVTIIGEKTFGKGVGQVVYDHKKKHILLAIVNHKWYVGDKNVLGVGIEPDMKVSGPTKEDYFKYVK
ncbi:MAG: tetratricopeptide repeat protein [Anaeromicrobium sp.]|uniref:tetratricopeptide repeat protein n=1 Tax=Anaeromicrobium sp. TaxID=1929132 RepID=UPI0025ED96EA|nr:tetratricopeptide repeat protein [Anaeromicrobium sp.]MCT4594219.1 tetratricopeptide repeat protein [Anaeromicrobium sp.]